MKNTHRITIAISIAVLLVLVSVSGTLAVTGQTSKGGDQVFAQGLWRHHKGWDAGDDEMNLRHGRGFPAWEFIDKDQLKQLVATHLGVTLEELEVVQSQGRKGLASLNIDPDSFHTATRNALQQLVDEAVDNGVMAQEDAEKLMQGKRHGHGHSRRFHGRDRTVEPPA